jgi:HSP20 family protein
MSEKDLQKTENPTAAERIRNVKTFVPRVDIYETKEALFLIADMPGVDEKEIEVTVSDNVVTIKGEKKEEKEDKGKNYYYMERSYGSFNREIPLSAETESDKAEASFKNGVLNITIPKSQTAKAKATKVPIKAA